MRISVTAYPSLTAQLRSTLAQLQLRPSNLAEPTKIGSLAQTVVLSAVENFLSEPIQEEWIHEQRLGLVKAQRDLHPDADLVFPAPRGAVLSDMVLTAFLRDQKAHSSETGRVATAHGFRSSFRDWASESGKARDLAERALAHTVSNQVEAAYHRTDLLEQRRTMMEEWAQHVGGCVASPKVVPLTRR